MNRGFHVICFLLFLVCIFNGGCKKNERLVAGGYTEGNEKGLTVFEFNVQNGSLRKISETDAGPNPSYFCFFGRNGLIYSLNEVMEFNGKAGGGLTTLKYNPENGSIEKKTRMNVPFGGPCYISASAGRDFLLFANYSSGSVAVVSLDKNGMPARVTDSVIYKTDAPAVSHPHMIAFDPAGKHLYLTDLGLDRIMIYDLDKNAGKLIPLNDLTFTVTKGSGPRHFVFNKAGTKMYVINELGSTIMVLAVSEKGALKLLQTLQSTRSDYKGDNACAEIHIDNDNRFIYGSNRGENSIAVFSIGGDGLLSPAGNVPCGGDWPRNFVIDPSGKYLLCGNQRSGDISVFKINEKTGIPEGPVFRTSIKSPAYLEFPN
ncbi:MAG: lactonase family protein [Bacteroidales bacterium]|jgi:6-phosphogluconolactonase